MEEKKRGGPRIGAGRKPVEIKKLPITTYVPENIIEPFKKGVEILIQDLTKPNVEIKPKAAAKSNFGINASKKEEVPVNEEKTVSGDNGELIGDIEKQIQALKKQMESCGTGFLGKRMRDKLGVEIYELEKQLDNLLK